MKNCLTTLAYALFAAGTLNAQIYDYDSANESLTITGKGNSVQDRITLEGPITPGNTVPGTSQVFGDTKTITLKDVWTSPDSIRVKYTEPTSAGNNTTLKLENSRLGASGDFDKGGTGLTLIMDSKSELNLYGNRLTNTTRIEKRWLYLNHKRHCVGKLVFVGQQDKHGFFGRSGRKRCLQFRERFLHRHG